MYRRNKTKWAKHIDFITLDLVCCLMSFIFAIFIYFDDLRPLDTELYRTTFFTLVLCNLVATFFGEPFSGVLKRGYLKEFKITAIHVAKVLLLLIAYMFVVKNSSSHSRLTIVFFAIIYFVISYISRCLWKRFIRLFAKHSLKNSNISLLVLIEKDMMQNVETSIINHNYGNYNIVGLCILDQDDVGKQYEDIPIVSNVDNVVEYVCREWVDEILIISEHTSPYKELISNFLEMGITQHIKINVVEELTGNANFIEHVGPYTCLTSSLKTANDTQLFLKRSLDIIGGLVGCFICLILMIVFYPIVKIKSPGPLFYSSTRIGKNGKKFKFYKFRSMVTNADDLKKELEKQNFMSDGMMFKVDHDPRIIKGYGEFIRKTSLDEFPQFFNVLKGDMSLVGARPPTPDEWEKYKLHHRVRLSVKPGITGMWQASGRSSITDFEEVVKLDSYYAHNWSLGLDIKLLFKTVIMVLTGKGSL